MMYNDVRAGEIPILSFLRGTNYAMYVGPNLSRAQREELRDLNITVPIIYLPEILDGLSESVIKYNFPGITIPETLTVESIYAQIRKEFKGRITPESMLVVKYTGDVLMMYDAKHAFYELIAFLKSKYAPTPKIVVKRSMIARRNLLLEELRQYVKTYDGFEKKFEEIYEKEIKPILYKPEPEPEPVPIYDSLSEESFNEEMEKATKEAEAMIKHLLLNGCPPKMILSWINESIQLSRIRITKQYKIFLTDYDNEEIKMGPLPKTVFIFFLRHPEGVMFSHLQDHREELRKIYGRVCKNDDPNQMEESINRLINPFDNSICEKCANVKKAFLVKIADNIASNYYISGNQGEKKGILLDRNLVQWECEL